jgi:hypothetical protein
MTKRVSIILIFATGTVLIFWGKDLFSSYLDNNEMQILSSNKKTIQTHVDDESLSVPNVEPKESNSAEHVLFLASQSEPQSVSFDKKLQSLIQRAPKTAVSTPVSSEFNEATAQFLNEVDEFGLASLFDKALELDTQFPGFFDFYAHLVILKSSSDELFLKLTNHGASYNLSSAIMTLNYDNANGLKLLHQAGVDIHEPVFSDITLLDISLAQKNTKQSILYMLEQNFSYNEYKPELGLDTVGVAIINSVKHPKYASLYSTKMVEQGAKFNKHHLQLLEQVAQENPELYTEIKVVVPGLGELYRYSRKVTLIPPPLLEIAIGINTAVSKVRPPAFN